MNVPGRLGPELAAAIIFGLPATSLALAFTEEPLRAWTEGGKTYQGKAIVIDDDEVVIALPDGETQTFKRDSLESGDRRYIERRGNFIAPKPKPPKGIPAAVLAEFRDIREPIHVPELSGGFWQIAENSPDVSPYNHPLGTHNACDFTIFQAADGTWQLIACIRGTTWSGATRLLHRWEARKLTDKTWIPRGIFYKASEEVGQSVRVGTQAPHCFRHESQYYLFYNCRGAYCMTSEDGKSFKHIKSREGEYKLFDMGRDVCLFHDEGTWYAYYCGSWNMHFRTAKGLLGPWSKPFTLEAKGNPESPFVLRYGDDYYLWQQEKVYRSRSPRSFAGHPITRMVLSGWKPGRWRGRVWAPEVILHEDQYYLAGYARGIFLCKMKWVKRTPEEIAQWRRANYNHWRPRTPVERALSRAGLKVYKKRREREMEEKMRNLREPTSDR